MRNNDNKRSGRQQRIIPDRTTYFLVKEWLLKVYRNPGRVLHQGPGKSRKK
jgi:hypothetical protein